ncbi:AAA family ATPase [Vibrio tritonius]
MMRIKTLSLTNFRAFQDTQVIEFAPVTLLFGSNSVGKSTVVTSLCYLHQLLTLGDCEPRRLQLSGNKFIGGFVHLINGKELNKTMSLKVEFDVTSANKENGYTESLFFLNQHQDVQNDRLWQECKPLLNSVAKQATSMAVELEVSWCTDRQMAYVSRCITSINGQEIATLKANQAASEATVASLQLNHPLLAVTPEQGSWLNERLGLSQAEQIRIQTRQGALPELGQRIHAFVESRDSLLKRRVEEVFSDCIVAPLDNLTQLLSRLINIGPLRQIPDSTYTAGKFI